MVRPARRGATDPPRKSKSPVGIIVIVVVLIVVVGGGAWFLMGMMGAASAAKVTSCANNLSQLWKLQNMYMMQYGGSERTFAPYTGRDFWRALERTPRPLVDKTDRDIFLCPVKGGSRAGGMDYLGPARLISELTGEDPVGGDQQGNHGGGGNVVHKHGGVLQYEEAKFQSLVKQLKP